MSEKEMLQAADAEFFKGIQVADTVNAISDLTMPELAEVEAFIKALISRRETAESGAVPAEG